MANKKRYFLFTAATPLDTLVKKVRAIVEINYYSNVEDEEIKKDLKTAKDFLKRRLKEAGGLDVTIREVKKKS